RLGSIRGIGETLRGKITALVTSGELPFYQELREQTPPGLLEMLRLPGIGPKKGKALYEKMAIVDLEKDKQACLLGQGAGIKGFGEKTQKRILEGIDFLSKTGQRVRLDEALELATALLEGLRSGPGIQRMEVCGSLRRRKESINDIDLLVSS